MPDCVQAENPVWLLRLIAGLQGMDGSQVREWLLRHRGEPDVPSIHGGDDGDGENRLDWHGWDQKTMLLMIAVNKLESLTDVLLKWFGVKDVKPNVLLPPSAVKPVRAETSDDVSQDGVKLTQAEAFARKLRLMFSGKGLSK